MSFQNNVREYKGQRINKTLVKLISKESPQELRDLIQSCDGNIGTLTLILENIGRVSTNTDLSFLSSLTKHENDTIRLLAVKNLGKLKSVEYLSMFSEIVANDKSTAVKREAVSSIGRIKKDVIVPILLNVLSNNDPKIVCQAIRGLLPFKSHSAVSEKLKKLIAHDNETVRTVIEKEFFSETTKNKPTRNHAESPNQLKNIIVHGDVRETLKLVCDESIHLTFTSPPYYNARDYSIYPSYEAYLDFLSEVFSDVYRITKEGRFLIVNTSPVIVPRISRAHSSKRYPIPFDLHIRLVNMGWEFIDDIVWMKPEYSVKNRIGGFQQHRKPLAYKPNSITEYLMVYRKKTDKLIDWNIKQYPTDIVEESKVADGFETTNVWQICPKSNKVHSAVFPEELCEKVLRYYSFEGDLVFDPFAGSGTFGRTAQQLNRYFFLTEKDETYFDYMKSSFINSLLYNKDTEFLTLDEFKEVMI